MLIDKYISYTKGANGNIFLEWSSQKISQKCFFSGLHRVDHQYSPGLGTNTWDPFQNL